jgi:glycosyltransferase involved in cell wall biosynthesis
MRVKNEAKYLAAGIASLEPLGGPVVVLDDGSTDDTGSIARSFDFVLYHRQDDLPMDEGRDRTFLLREALKLNPRWVFTLDGDEELPPTSPAKMLRAVDRCPDDVNALAMWLAVMAGRDQYYVGRWIWEMDRMFRVSAMVDPEGYEFASSYKNNLHCGCTPELRDYKRERVNIFIKYWGYETPEATAEHLAFYEQHDKVNFEKVSRLNFERVMSGATAPWRDTLCANDIGKRSVNY